jgi:hypothetical protein
MVFERVSGGKKVLVLLNATAQGKNYTFHAGWHPEYVRAQVLFWSDGGGKT